MAARMTNQTVARSRSISTKLLRGFAAVWIALGSALILFGYACVWWFEGFFALQAILSPWNIWNPLAVFLILSPGIGARLLAEKLDARL